MAESFQKEKPPARINLFLEVRKDGAKKKQELPLRMLVLGDFTQKESSTPLAEREKVNVNKEDFHKVMKASKLTLKMDDVPDVLHGGEMSVELSFDDLSSFHPEEVAKRVPELKKLLAMRSLLRDLRNRVIGSTQFRKELDRIVKDGAARENLSQELDKLIPVRTEKPTPPAEDPH